MKGLACGLLVAALALAPLAVDRKDALNLLVLIALNAALAQSWNLLGGYAGQPNLGHAAFFGTGALVTRLLWLGGAPLALSLLAGAGAATVLGTLVGLPALRLRGVYFAIGTLALAEILRVLVGNLLPNVSGLPGAEVARYSLVPRYYLLLSLAVVNTGLAAWLGRSKLGLGMMAVREDEAAAAATGVAPLPHKFAALALSTFLAGLTGGAFAYYHVSYYHQFAFSPVWTFEALLITYVGGAGTAAGPVLGAVFYVAAREILAVRFPEVHLYAFGALFIIVVLTWRGGLAVAAQRWYQRLAGRSSGTSRAA